MREEIQAPAEGRLRRLREAGEWLLRIQDPARTDADVDEWLRWCAADAENLAEFEKVQGDWRDLDALKASRRTEPVSGTRRSADLPASCRRMPRPKPSVRRASGLRYAAAIAACAGAIGIAAVLIRDRQGAGHAPQQIVATDMNRAATLPDGSRVILHPETILRVDYNSLQRSLDLVAGEAYFKVRHDQAHPFVVQVGDISVSDVGTAFDVRRESDRTTVTVEEGVVRIAGDRWAKEGLPSAWPVKAGYQFTYSENRRAVMMAHVDVASALHWRDDELAYVSEPLGSVVDDLNRYAAHKIVIKDPAISNLPFTGTAFPDSLADWLDAIEQAYPVEVRNTPDGTIVLTARAGQANLPPKP